MVEGRERVIKVMEDNKLGGCQLLCSSSTISTVRRFPSSGLTYTIPGCYGTVQKLGVGVISREKKATRYSS